MKNKHRMKTVIRRRAGVVVDQKETNVELIWNGSKWIDLTREDIENDSILDNFN